MKWPNWLMLVRHDTSAYNALKGKKAKHPLYREFLESWKESPVSKRTIELARAVQKEFTLVSGGAETPLNDENGDQAYQTGVSLRSEGGALPDIVFVSPFRRTLSTLEHLCRGWPELKSVKTIQEDRVREQDHGLALIYNDWRVFQTIHPEQRELRELEGPYWYRYPQGENVPDVRDRNRSFLTTLTRDFTGKKVFVVTHHLNILATRANLERLDAKDFLDLDKNDPPINCGVTKYSCNPRGGSSGKLELDYYNKKRYA